MTSVRARVAIRTQKRRRLLKSPSQEACKSAVVADLCSHLHSRPGSRERLQNAPYFGDCTPLDNFACGWFPEPRPSKGYQKGFSNRTAHQKKANAQCSLAFATNGRPYESCWSQTSARNLPPHIHVGSRADSIPCTPYIVSCQYQEDLEKSATATKCALVQWSPYGDPDSRSGGRLPIYFRQTTPPGYVRISRGLRLPRAKDKILRGQCRPV